MSKDDLLTVREIAPIVGLAESSTRVYHERASRRRREGGEPLPNEMPAPDQRFGRTPVWRRETIERWKAERS